MLGWWGSLVTMVSAQISSSSLDRGPKLRGRQLSGSVGHVFDTPVLQRLRLLSTEKKFCKRGRSQRYIEDSMDPIERHCEPPGIHGSRFKNECSKRWVSVAQGFEPTTQKKHQPRTCDHQKSGKMELSLQEAKDLLQHLPSEISDVLTDDFSDEEVPQIIHWNFRLSLKMTINRMNSRCSSSC
ncbi:hypothetical protein TNCV_2056101 [Trichonephila clavipes]|nr:hypothetical protein TNCV_2056101 [Trichonephila clavipes]